jgi:vacuolar-type H+-ATPase subunit H
MSDDIVETIIMKGKAAEEIRRLRDENEKFYKQAEMNARLLTENASLVAYNEKLREALYKQAEKHIRLIELMQEKETLHDPYEDGINAGLRLAANIIKESVEIGDE